MSKFGKFDNGESHDISFHLLEHPFLMLWAIGLGYEIIVDPAFKKAIYSGDWLLVAMYIAFAFWPPFLFLCIPVAVTSVLWQSKSEFLAYDEWRQKSGWLPMAGELKEDQLLKELQEAVANREKLPDLDYLNEEERQKWDREYRYRERFLCGRLVAISEDEVEAGPKFLRRFKSRQLAEQILFGAVIAAIASLLIWAMYFRA